MHSTSPPGMYLNVKENVKISGKKKFSNTSKEHWVASVMKTRRCRLF
jgi:hypothetical protein